MGNNNAYCQNNETSWFDWTLVERHGDIHRFARRLIASRLNRDVPAERFDVTLRELLGGRPLQWHGVKLNAPDWSEQSHTLAATSRLLGDRMLLHVMINAYSESLAFELPALGDAYDPWHRFVDTFLAAPNDICRPRDAPVVQSPTYQVQSRSVVILFAAAGAGAAHRHRAEGNER